MRRRQLLLETCEDRVLCSVVSVTNTNNSGAGSLRQAILDTNALVGADTIAFNIGGGGVQTISPTSALPTITDSLVIDGTTQPGYAGTPLIQIDGTGAVAGANGLQITGANSTIRGLAIFSFSADGILITGAGATGNVITANYIGTNATGTVDLGNSDDGIDLDSGASSNQILGNLISGNNSDGIDLGDSGANAANNIIRGNLIGTQANGASALGNSGSGILIGNGSTANGTQIGGTGATNGNTIAFNGAMGVRVVASTGVSILGNSITGNTNLGIDLGTAGVTANDALDPDGGANNLQNFPVLTYALRTVSGSTVSGTLNSVASSTFRLEFFANTAADALGNGEGQRYLGFITVTTNASGNASFTATFSSTVAVGEYVSATATDSANNTSEFSGNTLVVENPGVWLSTVGTTVATAGGLTTWTDGALVRFTNPNLALGAGTTGGTFSQVFDVDSFALDGNADINGLHVVGRSVTVGTVNPITVTAGDVLFTTAANETFSGTAFTSKDVIRFRPTVAGDYTAGTFSLLLRNPGNTNNAVRDFALVETATTVGSVNLQAGEFLLSLSGVAYQYDVSRFVPTTMATNPTGGTLSELIDGASAGVGIGQQIYSLALVEQNGTLGGQALQKGQILFGLAAADVVGTNNLSMTQYDFVALTVTASGTGTSSGVASMLFRGGNVGFNNANERPDALAIVLSNPPTLALPGAAPTFAEDAAAVAIDSTATIVDVDSADFSSGTLTVTISANADTADRLAIQNQGTGVGQIGVSGANVTYGGVTIGTFTGGTSGASPLVVTFNGNGSPVAAQALLRAITFSTVSDTPSTAARTISLVVTDGDAGTSNTATKTVNVTATNDAPALTVPGAQTASAGVALAIAGISFSDADAAAGSVTVTLNVTGGALTVNASVAGGLTAGGIAGNGSAAVTLTGTIAAINATLAHATGLQFLYNVSGTQTLTVTINDGGNSGADPSTLGLPATGGPTNEQAAGTVAITIAAPSLNVSSPAVTEGTDAYAIFTVSLSNATTLPVIVDLALAAITATGGSDYGLTLEVSTNGGASWNAATSATIAAGSTSVLVRTPILDDALDESVETLSLTATRTAGSTANASANATATIADDDPTPSLVIDDVTVNEAAGTVTFTVTLSAASGLPASVNYATSGGTAISGSDFTSTGGTLNFAAGVVTRTIVVTILNDALFETSETFNVTLSGAVNATISDVLGVGTIRDDGAGNGGTDNDTPTLSVSSPALTEGTDAHAVFAVSISNASLQSTTVSLGLSAGTATGGGTDFGAGLEVSTNGGASWGAASSAIIAAGGTSVLVRTPIINDALDESAETFTLTATRTGGTTTNASASGTATIADDDPTPTLAIGDVTVNEGAGTATFTVTLSAASGQTVTVEYATADGTAEEDADYTAAAGTLTFNSGATSATITVPILDDPNFEQVETFDVLLSSASNATISTVAAVGTIKDDGTGTGGTDNDTPTLSVSSPAVTEGSDAYAIFTVSLSNESTTPVDVSFALTAAVALGGGVDFGTGGAGNLQVSADGGGTWADATNATIVANSTSVLVRTPIVNDARNEATESFTLTATRASGLTTNGSASGTAIIADDDPIPLLAIDDVIVNEAAGIATFTVTLSAASGQSVSVNFATSNGTATAGSDYIAVSGALTFAAGVTSQTVVVSIANDVTFEGSETFHVMLSGAGNATIADALGIGAIRDDGAGLGGTDDDTPALSVSSVSVTEGTDTHAVFDVSLSNASTTAVDVSFGLVAGSAIGGGTDFGAIVEVSTDGGVSWSAGADATIAAGRTSVLVRSLIVDDALDEAAETFQLAVARTSGTTINATASGTATITDDDPTPSLIIDDVTVNEAAGLATFTVTLSAVSGLPVDVNFAMSDSTAMAGSDYASSSGALHFATGVTIRTITVPILNDAVFEGGESFSIFLSGALNATIADAIGLGTIRDDGGGAGGTDDDRPTLNVSDVAVAEGVDNFALFAVSLSNVSTTPVSVSLALSDGTAAGGGVDYGAGLEVSTDGGASWSLAGNATIAAGSTSVLVRTPIVDDALDEAAETFTLVASRTGGTTRNGSASSAATIADDDAAPSLSIDDVTVNENAGTATFTVTLGAASGQIVTVSYATADGSAQAGRDFTGVSGLLSFAPGVTTQTVTIPILNDTTFENTETFSVLLSGAVNATLGDANGVGTIANDDLPQAELSIVSTSEGATAGGDLVIGEVVRFELRFELAEGANALLTLQELLPTGLLFLPDAGVDVAYSNVATSVSGLAAGSYTNATNDGLISASLTADDDAFGDGTDIFFKLGTLVNNDRDADREFVTVRFEARATNTHANQAAVTHGSLFTALLDTNADGTPGYVSLDADGDNAATGAEGAVDPANDGSGAPGLSNTVTTQIAEPILTLDKQITSAPPTIRPGDTILYTVTITHAAGSGGTAWEATLVDAVPAGLDITQIDSVTLGGGAQVQSAAVITGGGAGLAGVWDMPVGGSVTVVYRATVTSDALLGASLANLANLTWSSLDGTSAEERGSGDSFFGGGGLNDYAREDSETVLIDPGAGSFAIDKSVVGDLNAEIGERLTYSVVITVGDGVIGPLTLRDVIPTGLQLVNGSASLSTSAGVVVGGSNFIYAANQLDLVLGSVQSAVDGLANTLTITYQVEVPDVAANDAFGSAAAKTNTATAGYASLAVQDSETVTIVEPRLAIAQSADDATPHLGQWVTYTIALSHAGGSSAEAHDLVLTEALPVGLTLDAASILVSGANVVTNTSTNGGALSLVLDGLALGDSATITFRARVTSDPVLIGGTFGGGDDTFTSIANLSYDTQPGTPATGQRTSSAVASSTITVVGADLAVTKDDGVVTVTPGGRLTYTIRVTNHGTDTATNVGIADTLPPGTTFNAVLSSPSATVSAGILGFHLASLAAGATQIFTVVVDVNAPATAGREMLTNTVTVTHDDLDPTFADNTASDTDTVSGVPDYVITKTDGVTSAKPGETLAYTITVTNVGDQDGSGVVVSDVFATGLFSSVIASSGGVVNLAAGSVHWNVGDLAAGDSVTLTLTAKLRTTFASIFIPAGTPPGAIPDNNTITNRATVTDDGTGGADLTPLDNAALDEDDLVPVPELKITLRDRVTLVEPGQVFTYTIVATNAGQHESNGMVVTDRLPAGVTFVRATSNDPALSGPAIRTGQRVAWNFSAPVPDNTSVTFTITVRVNADVPPASQLTNVVTIRDDGRYGPDAINLSDNVARATNATPAAVVPLRTSEAAPVADPLDFRWDAFRNFAAPEMRIGANYRIASIEVDRAALLPLMPIFSGSGDPGATLVIDLFNPKGERIGSQTVFADAGGSWLATFPTTTLTDSSNTARISQFAGPYSSSNSRCGSLQASFAPAITAGQWQIESRGAACGASSAPLLDGLCLE